ncbi:ATP synthase F1 subunit epsilon [Eggerthella sinensis]|jgi:F-type H+-transporting ATPase subunit epsilon|uniref:ATP synthase epsilon chain n=1 Tax=Eggerthella sinensis TaxID=242230 RepID=A0A3N0J039_9ACTN|nr:ATP synthase F1 subunit epsilon [Eggerthella sinensis]MCB7038138.1 ATP synthase F1 subunit epsilon [Eggerthella sinensis]RDB69624.1 ATP synthase F1 subunit epsilon [Eggerthella sinensis]RNM42515.1 ATP synthase F1 subunit epsilon [Eggerthella sinensis]
MAGFMCDIVTPVAKLVSQEVELVVVPGVEGEMGFLKGHAPLVSVLADGEARVKAPDASEVAHYALQGGYVEVTDDKVIILADRALPVADINVDQVREQLAGIEEQLSGLSEEEARKTTLAADKAWCTVQLKAAHAA